jgi:large subunit ribosomal protein L10
MELSQKQEITEQLRAELGNAASVLITDLTGVPVEKSNELRSRFRARGVRYQVAKNTLVKRAVAGTPAEAMGSLLVGPSALAWHPEEPALPAQIFREFAREYDKLALKGGYVDGDIYKGDEALKLADLPSKDQLRAQLLGLIKQVPGKFLALLETPHRQMLAVLTNYQKKLEEKQSA